MGLGRTQRSEDFGRYDPVNHVLLIDRTEKVDPGVPSAPIAISVGQQGRLHSVLHCNDDDVLKRAARSGVPMVETAMQTREHHRRNVARPEKFGRYDPLTASLTFRIADGSEHRVKVGDRGRLRSVFESGKMDRASAKELGLPPPPPVSGRRNNPAPMAAYNPFTLEYSTSANSTPRDSPRMEGKRTVGMEQSLTPRFNPLTQHVDRLNSTSASLRLYNPRLLPTFAPNDVTSWRTHGVAPPSVRA